MRVAALLPAATDIVIALGAADQPVGVEVLAKVLHPDIFGEAGQSSAVRVPAP